MASRESRRYALLPSTWSTWDRFFVIAGVNLLFLWLIIVTGALVRLTGSGLGCPDWPLCDGGVVPAAGYNQVIEFGNRVLSALVVAVTVVTYLTARGLPGNGTLARRLALGAVLCSVGQVPLGGITVLTSLHPLMVGAHFLLSVIALSLGVLLVLHSLDRRAGRVRGHEGRRGPLAWVTLGVLAVVVISGVLTTAAGPHSGDSEVITRFGHLEESAFVHLRAVAVLVVLMLTLAIWLVREPSRDPNARRLAAWFLPAFAVQITLGEFQYRTGMPWEVIAFHVGAAGIVWSLGLALCWSLARPAMPAPHTERQIAGATSPTLEEQPVA